ncbi:MAG: DsbA family protein [Pseudomonadota bacterium]
MRRRDALVLGGIVATAVALPPILRRLPSDFEFQPIAGTEGFRRLVTGSFSGGVDPFFGLGEDRLPTHRKPLCTSLFGAEGWSGQRVPVAFFTDANCPYCKDIEGRLVKMRDGGAPIRLIWHELPLLGPSSIRHAQAILAARLMGAEEAARDYLSNRALRPGAIALKELARALGLDEEVYLLSVRSPRVEALIAESIALGRRLGIPGTPGTVIGRTLVIGAIKDADLRKLIELERNMPQTVCD